MRKLFLFSLLVLLAGSLYAQSHQLHGVVRDEDGEPLPGASIAVEGTTIGTVAAKDGTFILTLPSGDASIRVSFVGYSVQTIKVENRSEIIVVMQEEASVLDEAVVVGFGTQKKPNITGSVQTVTSKELVKRTAPNASTALQGLVAGMLVEQGTGRPGDNGAAIEIHGKGSINSATAPLILIDGVERDINAIDFSAIESVSVLKDAASASIYGSKSANGVILITTKRGSGEGLTISYNGYLGIQQPTKMATPVSAAQYMRNMNAANMNAGGSGIYSEERIVDLETYGPDNWKIYDTNWKDELFKNNPLMHKHVISISNSSKFINFYANAAYQFEDGLIDNVNNQRITLKVNSDILLASWLKGGLDLSFKQNDRKLPSMETPEALINSALTLSPIYGGINRDGTYANGQNGYNPIAIIAVGGLQYYTAPELSIKASLTANPIKGMELHAFYNRRTVEGRVRQFQQPYQTYDQGYPVYSYPSGSTGAKYESYAKNIHTDYTAQASYERTMSRHYFKVLVGGHAEHTLNRSFSGANKDYFFPGYDDISMGGSPEKQTASGTHSAYSLAGVFGRINYSFNGRYLFEINGRYDGSSRFSRLHRWGFFPSASAGWRISDENFFTNIKHIVNYLKIRASYGTLGNESVGGYYPFTAVINTGGYGYMFDERQLFGGAQTQVANELISWEKSTQSDIGLEFGLWKNRLSGEFDVYQRNITEMLQTFPIPYYVGMSAALQNAGDMRVRGWDLTMTWRDRIGEFGYSVKVNLSDALSVVTDLKGLDYGDGSSIIKEGVALRSLKGYRNDGFYQSEDDIKNSPGYNVAADDHATKLKTFKPGDIKYKDLSGPEGKPDGIISSEYDREIMGYPYSRYEYSATLGADWKGFDLSIMLQGIGKKNIYLSGQGVQPFYNGRSMYTYQENYWREDNRNAEFPRLLTITNQSVHQNYYYSDFWMKSGAYLRVKNVVLGYTLPKKIVQRIKIDNIRFYLSGQNLLTFDHAYEGYDPENYVSNGSFYPIMRTLTFGVDVQF